MRISVSWLTLSIVVLPIWEPVPSFAGHVVSDLGLRPCGTPLGGIQQCHKLLPLSAG